MIKLKTLIKESKSGIITSRDIFNFYFLWYITVNHPSLVQPPFGKEILNYYLKSFKETYLKVFTNLLYRQIEKYVKLNRIDKDFPKNQLSKESSPKELLELMKKTWRSDLKRRNDAWILIAEFNYNLSNAILARDIFMWIDRLNNTIHNTGTSILGKVDYSLVRAYNIVHQSKSVESYKQFVDKDIRELMNQETLNEDDIHQGLYGEPKKIPSNREKDIRKPVIKFDDNEDNTSKDPKLPTTLKIGPL